MTLGMSSSHRNCWHKQWRGVIKKCSGRNLNSNCFRQWFNLLYRHSEVFRWDWIIISLLNTDSMRCLHVQIGPMSWLLRNRNIQDTNHNQRWSSRAVAPICACIVIQIQTIGRRFWMKWRECIWVVTLQCNLLIQVGFTVWKLGIRIRTRIE